jgi:uncharacterized protein (TIGR03118 family)
MTKQRRAALFAASLGLALQVSTMAWADYIQTNLVSNIPGLAILLDPNLKNPWGMSHSPTSPFWISDQGANLSTLYAVSAAGVSKTPLEVSIPTTASGPQGPTGQVFNGSSSFLVNTTPATFIFSNLNGTISGWNGSAGTTAVIRATTPGAVYTGLATGSSASGPTLYAANGAQNRIDVFDGIFTDVTSTTFAGQFVNPLVPAGLVPFNVENIDGQIYVTYAPAGPVAQRNAVEGQGAVAVFDTNGNFVRQVVAGSELAAPWGITLAPTNFGPFSGSLLVGNFSFLFSEINAFDALTGLFLGTIPIDPGAAPGGLWSLGFGYAGNNGNPTTLFFTDGINGELDGLFSSIVFAAPEPPTLALLGLGALGALALGRRRRTSRIA